MDQYRNTYLELAKLGGKTAALATRLLLLLLTSLPALS